LVEKVSVQTRDLMLENKQYIISDESCKTFFAILAKRLSDSFETKSYQIFDVGDVVEYSCEQNNKTIRYYYVRSYKSHIILRDDEGEILAILYKLATNLIDKIIQEFNFYSNFQVYYDYGEKKIQLYFPSLVEYQEELTIIKAENMGYQPESVEKEILISVRQYRYNVKVRKTSLSSTKVASVEISQLMKIILNLITQLYHKTSICGNNNNMGD